MNDELLDDFGLYFCKDLKMNDELLDDFGLYFCKDLKPDSGLKSTP
jgi:hypothetical protein